MSGISEHDGCPKTNIVHEQLDTQHAMSSVYNTSDMK